MNQVIRTTSSLLFFLTIKFWAHKSVNQTKASQQNKNTRTKNNRGNNFLSRNSSKREKIVYFAVPKRNWNCPDNLIHCTTEKTWFLTLPLSSWFYSFISTHKTLLPNRQDKRLLSYETFKNASSKPVRGRFHGCATLTSKETLDT